MFRFLVQRNHSDDFKVYSHTQQDMMLFFKQHNINLQNVNVEYVDTIKDSQEQHVLKLYKFRSNKSPELFRIMTSEYIIQYALQLAGDHLSDACVFGAAIFRDDIEFIKRIVDLLGKLPHVSIIDYTLLDDINIFGYDWNCVKSDKLFEYDFAPNLSEIDTQDIYASLYETSGVDLIQPVTVEAYVRAFAELVINQMIDKPF